MTKPDYRALCAELVDAILTPNPYNWEDSLHDSANRARALLAEPVAEEPTDEEIMELMPQQMRDDLAAAARALAGFDNPKAAGAMRIILNRHAVDHARAVLARWGRPTPQPPADMEAGKPVAWMCPAESYWDGKEWQPRWQVTTDQKLAEYWARPDKPTPLFANALPIPEATND